MKIEPVVLEGERIRLEPLAIDHAPGLLAAASYPEIWRWMPFAIESEEQMEGFLKVALRMAEAKTALPFAIILKTVDSPVGATGYWYIESRHRRLEIGASWVTPKWQRSAVNFDCMSQNRQTVAARCDRKAARYSIEASEAMAEERGLTRDVDVG